MSEISHGRPGGDAVAGVGAGPGMPGNGTVPPDVDLGRVWTGVAATVWRRDPGPCERLAGRLLRSPALARALLTAPALLVPWLISSAVVLAAGAVGTAGTGTPLVALLAPALAAVGIVYAYGPGVDEAFELSRSTPVSDLMVLLVRGLGVLGADAALGLAASAASGAAVPITFGWLVPMTAVAAVALAAATIARSAAVGVTAGLGSWCVTVLAGQAVSGHVAVAVTDPSLFVYYLAAAALAGVIVVYATRIPDWRWSLNPRERKP